MAEIEDSEEKIAEERQGEKTALIFDIDRYAIHDGQGLRCLVFMKGCPLKCIWCSNPEGQGFKPETAFFPAKCIGCGACAEVCPQGAIVMAEGKPQVDWEKCDHCGKCTELCYAEARRTFGYTMTVSELLAEVKKNVIFFNNSGGGVTMSGGEALAQADFLVDLFKSCKQEKINTAIETCGYSSWQALKNVSEYTDMIFYDIKQMDPEVHLEITGVRNERILENLQKLSQQAVDYIVRIPVIPGLNDDEKNIRATAKFVSSNLNLSQFKRLELLPYHAYGAFKYDRLGRNYSLDQKAPGDEKMQGLKVMVEEYGLNCKIGG